MQTVHENIADNSGVRAAYYAYLESLKESNYTDKCLPGLDYTPQQMFWIAASNVFCTSGRTYFVEMHSPSKIRMAAAFSNMNEFSRDFNCKLGSEMNPEDKCYIP